MEDRAGGIELDGYGHGHPYGQGDEDDQKGNKPIKSTFEHQAISQPWAGN
jgi:hypothetical protein